MTGEAWILVGSEVRRDKLVLSCLGGKRENRDPGPEHTAWREFWEESGKVGCDSSGGCCSRGASLYRVIPVLFVHDVFVREYHSVGIFRQLHHRGFACAGKACFYCSRIILRRSSRTGFWEHNFENFSNLGSYLCVVGGSVMFRVTCIAVLMSVVHENSDKT